MISAACRSLSAAWNSPSALMTFGAAVAFGFRLSGHGPLHRLGEIHILDFHDGDFNSPRLGVPIDDLLQAAVHFIPLRQQVIEFGLTQRAAQGGQGHLGSGEQEILHLQHGPHGIDNPEIEHGIDADRDVVPGDDVLGLDDFCDGPQVDRASCCRPARRP